MAKLYDIQGKPIKVGYLVAFAGAHGGLLKGRVRKLYEVSVDIEEGLGFPSARQCVVLEEPLWPNS